MSAYFDALREQLEPELVCPKCRESNRDGAARQVTLVDRESAACATCGHAGARNTFQPQEKS